MPRPAAGMANLFSGLSLGLLETGCGWLSYVAKIIRHLPLDLKRSIERSVDPQVQFKPI